jgi:hypothetical protein
MSLQPLRLQVASGAFTPFAAEFEQNIEVIYEAALKKFPPDYRACSGASFLALMEAGKLP